MRIVVSRASQSHLLVGLLLVQTFLGACGCGAKQAERGKVSGLVTIDGKPVTEGHVCFWPLSGRPALGQIGPDGTYRLTTYSPDDGAKIGPHRVTIEAKQVIGKQDRPKSIEDEAKLKQPSTRGKVVWLVPESYSKLESSKLDAIVEQGDNRIDFALSSK